VQLDSEQAEEEASVDESNMSGKLNLMGKIEMMKQSMDDVMTDMAASKEQVEEVDSGGHLLGG